MKVYLNRIDGIDDAIISMFLSKRTLTRELEMEIRKETLANSNNVEFAESETSWENDPLGALKEQVSVKMDDWLKKLFKWGVHHITMLRFIDLSSLSIGRGLLNWR